MFKKLKDKIAEEVKSSPQRIQQFAQAAQAAVTSASSSISDISNNDLFSIADDDTPQNTPNLGTPNHLATGFENISLTNDTTNSNNFGPENTGSSVNSRIRKLSNSSNISSTSDVSFRLPHYDSPANMYHLQSDLDVSASEIEDSAKNVPPQLERVSKEQLYSAYRKSNEKYNKYRGRYTDLARHYKNLERENAKAKSVLVETQDKALRRISELREQCALEQSAKAHLESSLRLELDEKNMKIESLSTKIKLLHSFSQEAHPHPPLSGDAESEGRIKKPSEIEDEGVKSEALLIDVTPTNQQETVDSERSQSASQTEVAKLNDRVQKLEQLITKFKDAIKIQKEKNSQLSTELQLCSKQMDKKNEENEQLKAEISRSLEMESNLQQSREQIVKLKSELENFNIEKVKEFSTLKTNLNDANEKIFNLNEQVDVMRKREEENAISLAENKLRIHKELDSKENEIRVLKDTIMGSNLEIKSNQENIKELNAKIKTYSIEVNTMKEQLVDLEMTKELSKQLEGKLLEMEASYQELQGKCSKLEERIKFKELELKEEMDEKLAVQDRNAFLEGRNRQLSEDLAKRNQQIVLLEREMSKVTNGEANSGKDANAELEEIRELLRTKCIELESTQHDANERQMTFNKSFDELEKKCASLSAQLEEKDKMVSRLEHSNEEKRCLMDQHDALLRDKTDLEYKVKQLNTLVDGLSAWDSDLTLEGKLTTVAEMIQARCELQQLYEKTLADGNQHLHRISELESVVKELDSVKNLNCKLLDEKRDIEHKLTEFDEIYKQNVSLVSQNKQLVEDSLGLKNKIEQLSSDIKDLTLKYEEMCLLKKNLEEKTTSLENEYAEQTIRTNALTQNVQQLQNEIVSLNESHSQTLSQKNSIEDTMSQMEKASALKQQQIMQSNKELEALVEKLTEDNVLMAGEKAKLMTRLDALEHEVKIECMKCEEHLNNNHTLQTKLSEIQSDNVFLREKCDRLDQEKHATCDTITKLELEISELHGCKHKAQETTAQLQNDLLAVNNHTKSLLCEKEIIEKDLNNRISENVNNIQKLNDEMAELKMVLEKAKNQVIDLQSKLETESAEKGELVSKLDLSYSKIKDIEDLHAERTLLVKQISDLEESGKSNVDKLQAENSALLLKCKDYQHVLDANSNLSAENENMLIKLHIMDKIEEENKSLMEEKQVLKSEVNKLSSDIEGLQGHLKHVSQSNSDLSEKLRTLEASDHQGNTLSATEMQKQLNDMTEANGQLSEKLKSSESLHIKIQDLERQNSILLEEKLELQDQINCAISRPPNIEEAEGFGNDLEINKLRSQCTQLLNTKMDLERRLADLELISRSGDSSIRALEQKNEKLKLTKEKLERRLDETLVSLNHIRTLEENTELEYLRNILYEYLTGPSNNNLVLAKVLSAVVKFDQRQTQIVMEREKEKQGLLGQLGLL